MIKSQTHSSILSRRSFFAKADHPTIQSPNPKTVQLLLSFHFQIYLSHVYWQETNIANVVHLLLL